jgi:8-oxo-dGTP diphosphatase
MPRSRRPSIWAAGGVLTRRGDNGKPEYLVIYRKHYDDWSLPKGKLNRRETFRQAAMREIHEETGFRGPVLGRIGSIAYETPAGNQKVVRYWLVEASKGKFRQNKEVAAVEWLTGRKARARLTYERDRAVLTRGVEMVRRPDSGRMFLTRHARAGDRNQWERSDQLRPLSQRGVKQAEALADYFLHLPVERIYSSPFDRCEQTVEPLGRTLGIKTRNHKALTEGAGPRNLAALVRKLGSTHAVLSSQGDVIGDYIGMLARKGIEIDGPLEWRKGSIWVLDTRKGKVVEARYVPPLA